MMLDHPEGVEPELVGHSCLLECVLEDATLDVSGERARHRQLEEEAELHGVGDPPNTDRQSRRVFD
jgi:hypothetical protein